MRAVHAARFHQDHTCLGCGCTDSHACDEGCWWLVRFQDGTGVCSSCGDVPAMLDRSAGILRRVACREPPDVRRQAMLFVRKLEAKSVRTKRALQALMRGSKHENHHREHP